MATTTTAAPTPAQTSRDESITPFEWIQLHSKALTILLVVALALGAGYALWKRSLAIKEENAEKAYYQALRAAQGGNAQAAETELQRLVTRYAGTASATQGAMSLATLRYEAGKHAEGIKVLEQIQAEGVPESFQASVEALIAAGYSDMGKHPESAAKYRLAADKANFPADRDSYLGEAARQLAAANQPQEALAIWKGIAENPDSPGSAEARVRIGELAARAVVK